MTTWTDRQADIIDEHVAEFRKDNDRDPDRGELHEVLIDRMREEDGTSLGREIGDIIDVMAADR